MVILLDVSLSDKNSRVVNRSSESLFVSDGLESSIHDSGRSKSEDVIAFVFRFSEETVLEHSSHKGSPFEDSSGVFFVKGKKFSGSFSEFGKGELNSPYFFLVFQTVLSDNLQSVSI